VASTRHSQLLASATDRLPGESSIENTSGPYTNYVTYQPVNGDHWSVLPLPKDRRPDPFLHFNSDLNYDDNKNSESLFHPDYPLLPDLPHLDEFVDIDQAFSTSSELSNLMGSSLPCLAPLEALRSPRTLIPSTLSTSTPHVPRDSSPPTSLGHRDSLSSNSEAPRPLEMAKGRVWACLTCGKGFSAKALLDRHCQSHQKLVCPRGCGEIAKSKKDLQRHVDLVHDDKKLSCDFCDYRGRKDNLKRHVKTCDPRTKFKKGQRKRRQTVERSEDEITRIRVEEPAAHYS
jgi:uncharacterized C2H2 Zn-finger protein